ncbi:MAG: serine hydroxymethyltransferase [Bdellovibrionales bacterium]|nr:serine hydroxymethyltransferase [Ramlibacter sp.]
MTRLLPGPLETLDPEVASLIAQEAQRQSDRLELVASENHISMAQREASGSVLADTTVEGYPGARFLAASANVDALERLAVARACQLFGARFANVQPHSGTQANQAAMMALLQPGDTLLSMDPLAGGHFSHGASGTLSGDWFTARHYGVDPHTGLIDPDEVLALARQHRPRLIIAGASAYPRSIDFERFAAIAREVGARLLVDMAHVAGLVASGHFPNPLPHADVVTTTTYKNFRGPRGGLILCNDAALAAQLDAALCPGLQGTPLMHIIAAKAVAFGEALQPAYREYSAQVLRNARALGAALSACGIAQLTGGTDVPFVVADLRPLGLQAAPLVQTLDTLQVGCNAVPVPGDEDFGHARGLRLGVSAMTTRGMAESECLIIATIVADTARALAAGQSPPGRAAEAIRALCRRFPLDALDPVSPAEADPPTSPSQPFTSRSQPL